jgi:hypothetical protein
MLADLVRPATNYAPAKPPTDAPDRGENSWLPIATAEAPRGCEEKCEVKDDTGAIFRAVMYGDLLKIVVYRPDGRGLFVYHPEEALGLSHWRP